MIYTPQDDSYLIEKYVKEYAAGKVVLDVGAGSGILSLAAQSVGAKSVLALDINKAVVNHLRAQGIKTIESDLFDNLDSKLTFDLIVFNPPYLPKDSLEDEESAVVTTGGERGDEIILRFLNNVTAFLKPKGIILLVVSSLTPRNKINSVLKRLNLKKKILENKKLFMEILECWEIKR